MSLHSVAVLCPKGHSVQRFRVKRDHMHRRRYTSLRYKCHICGSWIAKQIYPYICHFCQYTLCDYCYQKELVDTRHKGIGILKYSSITVSNHSKGNTPNTLTILSSISSPSLRRQQWEAKYKWYYCSLDTIQNELHPQYWYTAMEYIVQIIENVFTAKSLVSSHRYKDYYKLQSELCKLCKRHPVWNNMFNLLQKCGFSVFKNKFRRETRESEWEYCFSDAGSITPQLYCSLKYMVRQTYRLDLNDYEQRKVCEMLEHTAISDLIATLYCFHFFDGMHRDLCDVIGAFIGGTEMIKLCGKGFDYTAGIRRFHDTEVTQNRMLYITMDHYVYIFVRLNNETPERIDGNMHKDDQCIATMSDSDSSFYCDYGGPGF
eukprot:65897_1